MIKTEDSLLYDVFLYVKDKLKENLVSIFGIGSYFHEDTNNFKPNDIDVLVFVKTFDQEALNFKSLEYSNARFEEKIFEDKKISIIYNLFSALSNEKEFKKYSFSNYKWAIIDLKYNSKIIFGKDFRNKLLDVTYKDDDYDDLLRRAFYYLNKSLRIEINGNDIPSAEMIFSKAIFKFSYYLVVLFQKEYKKTTLTKIYEKILELCEQNKIDKEFLDFLNEVFHFRQKRKFKPVFPKRRKEYVNNPYKYMNLRNRFILYTLNIIEKGKVHKKMNHSKIIQFLENSFDNGLTYLIKNINILGEEREFSKQCIDCGIPISSKYKMCYFCFVGFMAKLKNFCVDCRQEMQLHQNYLRCYRCNQYYRD